MTKQKSTKRALLLSALSLLMCVSMLIGSTFAWFTDSVTSGRNKIVAGTLDIDLFKINDPMGMVMGTEGAVTEITDSSDPIFGEDILWEPGYEAVANLQLVNNGNLALKWQTVIRPTAEVGELAEVIDVYVSEDELVYTPNGREFYEGKMTKIGTLNDVMTGSAIMSGEMKEAGDVAFFSIVLKMQEEAGNEYQGKTAGAFDITVLATQLTYESDSFDNQYDANASYDDAILAFGGVINLEADRTSAMTVAEDAKVVINMNDYTLSNTLTNNGEVSVNDGTIEVADAGLDNFGTATLTNVVMNAGSAADYANRTSGADAETTYDNVTINSAGGGVGVADGATVTFNSGSVEVNSTSTSGRYLFYVVGESSELTINDGNFDFNKTQNQKRAYIYVGEGATVYVNGGTFGKASTRNGYTAGILGDGTVIITGGTFGFNPSNWVANGYKAEKVGDNWIVVSNEVDAVVSTPADLASSLTDAASAGAGDSTIVITGDIDMTGTTWTPISVDGYNGAGVITIEGNGATIKGLTAPLFAGGFAGNSGIVIKNLTIADSNIVCTSGLGGGAFIDSADSMHVITLENCHLVNSTVSGERAGGLIGWCSGYAKENDGPVKAYITISNCSVVDSTVTGAGSAGAIAGHPGASDYTYTTIENCKVKNVDVTSNDVGSWRTGAVVGTANNGHIVINNVAVEDVTLTQNGVTADEIVLYGRFVPSGTGTLVIDGVEIK